MPLFSLTINNLAPAMDKKFQEVQKIDAYLELAAAAVHRAQGQSTSANILDANNVVVGNWTYTPQASS